MFDDLSATIATALFGGDGDDTLQGGKGADLVDGGEGSDIINGARRITFGKPIPSV